ncbi:sensor histidine kinase [Pseudomonas sp. S37]|nr:sensor histidine kinase [Pseudomonas sp. S36]MBK4991871.1 sensor histidine kinase [Pseudomonas sp. S37]MBK5006349.1 sensor histidine kinase [Pseudomonas sp. S32]MBK5009486.1 sensor histidine kinase [Pseudomonas sp. S60]
MIAHGQAFHAFAHSLDDAASFVPKNAREDPFGILPGERVRICMTYPGRYDTDQHLTGFRRLDVNLNNFQWLLGPKCYSCS